MRNLIIISLVAVFFVSCKGRKSGQESASVVIATSSWTAAYAEVAGAENVVVLAPFEMEHPSEYELRPTDIAKLTEAKLIIYAGYEVMAEKLQVGLGIPADKLLKVNTDYSYEAIERSVLEISRKTDSEAKARENLAEIRRVFDEGRAALTAFSGKPVAVHRFQASLAKELGLDARIIFGPAHPEASVIAKAAGSGAALIIDNRHNPVGLPLKEVLPEARYVEFLNFPGASGTKNLADVIRYNVSLIGN
ncbi:MAG: hypothetical protein LBR84_09085 [Tannerella sp.]|jgi:hypothetical protein|nr:hypothetical protein [Tannerella sp.]